jgi:hypothetical protein
MIGTAGGAATSAGVRMASVVNIGTADGVVTSAGGPLAVMIGTADGAAIIAGARIATLIEVACDRTLHDFAKSPCFDPTGALECCDKGRVSRGRRWRSLPKTPKAQGASAGPPTSCSGRLSDSKGLTFPAHFLIAGIAKNLFPDKLSPRDGTAKGVP